MLFFLSLFDKHESCVFVSASSLAVAECAGALAELHPAAFITKLIPRLKEEMFSGKWNTCENTKQILIFVLSHAPIGLFHALFSIFWDSF